MHDKTVSFIQITILAVIWLVSLVVFALFITSPQANDFWINILASLFLSLIIAIITLSVVILKNLPGCLMLYSLFQMAAGDTILIMAANIFVPSRQAYTYKGPLRFGGYVISWEEYLAAFQLHRLIEQDILANYPERLRQIVHKVIPKTKPLRCLLQIAPMDEHRLQRVADEHGLSEPATIISFGSPESNWLTAYVSEYHPGWLKFSVDGQHIVVARGTSSEEYSLNDYTDLGIVQRVTLPNEKMTVIVLAGLSDLSTRMCATFLLDNWYQIASKYKDGSDFGICLGIPLDEPEAYDRPKVISAYPKKGW